MKIISDFFMSIYNISFYLIIYLNRINNYEEFL
jgi:hypothetical protein